MKLFENFLEEYLKNVKKKLPESFRAKQLEAGGLEAGLVYKFETDFLKEPFLKAIKKTRAKCITADEAREIIKRLMEKDTKLTKKCEKIWIDFLRSKEGDKIRDEWNDLVREMTDGLAIVCFLRDRFEENRKSIDLKKIKPCSNISLHDFPDLKDETKCRDCGKTVREIKELAVKTKKEGI
jgi:hypothetical protein